jgi:hypothetical protein
MNLADNRWIADLELAEGDESLDWGALPQVKQHLIHERGEDRSFREALAETEAPWLSLWRRESRKPRRKGVARAA